MFYEKTAGLISRSFTKLQLEQLLSQLGITVQKGEKKDTHVKLLLENWRMPPPVKVEEEVEDELAERDFPLLPSELFLLMGTDGSDLLRLSHTYQARLTPIPNPLRLRAYGKSDALENMAAEIESRKANMISRTWKLECSAGVRSDLIQTISRISGAFIENAGEAEVRVTALDEESAEVARRLAERAGIEARDAVRRPILAHIPPRDEPSAGLHSHLSRQNHYALYPFLVPGILPWTMGYSNPFRVRRVGDWFTEDQRATSSPSISSGRWCSNDGTSKTLREALLGGLPALPLGFSRTVCATAGYNLVSAPGSQSLARVSLVPPIRELFNFDTFMNWLTAGNGSTTFLPGVPPNIRADTLKPRRLAAVEDVLVYRLRYQARDDSSVTPPKKPPPRTPPPASTRNRKEVFDVQINFTMWEAYNSTFISPVHSEHGSSHDVSTFISPIQSESDLPRRPLDRYTSGSSAIPPRVMMARRGSSSSLDVLLPDRQFDMQISVLDLIRVASTDIPKALLEHLVDCRRAFAANDKLPESPFTLVLDDVTYHLTASEVVRTSQHEESDVNRIFEGGAPHGQTAVTVVEKVADRDILDQQTLQCRVYSSEPRLDVIWDKFLAQCEDITGVPEEEDLAFQLFALPKQTDRQKQKMYA